jgi:hypothetical protein
VIPGDHRVLDMRLNGVVFAQDGANAALSVPSTTLVGLSLGDDCHAAVLCNLEGVAKAGDAATNNENVVALR